MKILDENGDLFGTVNVIDALVVVLVIAVGIAGIAVVGTLGTEPDTETTDSDNDTTIDNDTDSDNDTDPGELQPTTVEIDLEELNEREASQYEAGMTETEATETLATIEDIEREPTSVIVESADGDLYERDHPTKTDLTLTVELQTRATDSGLEYSGESLSNGDTLALEFNGLTIEDRVWLAADQ